MIDDWGYIVPRHLEQTWLAIKEAEAQPRKVVQIAKTYTKFTKRNATFAGIYPEIRDNIFCLCYWMNYNPTWQQAKLLWLVMTGHLRITTKSGQGPGKTAASIYVAIWWQFQDSDVKTMIVGPSMEQLRNGWLPEAAERVEKAHWCIRQRIEVTKSRIIFFGRDQHWYIFLKTASRAENMQGKHNKRLNVIIDEASGVARDIVETCEGTISNTKSEFDQEAEPGCMLLIGNPNAIDCYFYDTFFGKIAKNWVKLTFNAEESPIVDQAKLARNAEEFGGRDSNFYRVRVLGEFPKMAAAGIVFADDLQACVENSMTKAANANKQRAFGIDFARRGGDETVLIRRKGWAVVQFNVYARTPDFEPIVAVRDAMRWQKESNWRDEWCQYVIDADGMGQGLAWPLIEQSKNVYEFHANAVPMNPTKFANCISEAWWMIGRLFRKRLIKIPDDHLLRDQLLKRQWRDDLDNKGRIAVESKKEYRKRTGEDSPDRADALVMCFYQTALAGTKSAGKQASKQSPGNI